MSGIDSFIHQWTQATVLLCFFPPIPDESAPPFPDSLYCLRFTSQAMLIFFIYFFSPSCLSLCCKECTLNHEAFHSEPAVIVWDPVEAELLLLADSLLMQSNYFLPLHLSPSVPESHPIRLLCSL